MNSKETLQEALRNLEKLTGLPVSLRQEEIGDPQETVLRIRRLCHTLAQAEEPADMIRRWLTGQMRDEDFFACSDRLLPDPDRQRGLFLIRFENAVTAQASLILKNLFPDREILLIPLDRRELLTACCYPDHTRPDPRETAAGILCALQAELMEQAVISCCARAGSLELLPEMFRKCQLALKAGMVYFPDRTVYVFEDLGIGQLLDGCSSQAREDFIRSNLGEGFLTGSSPAFDAESRNTAACFLRNDLNIAETARQLHMHRNTLLYRLEQIEKETGLDIRRFADAMTYQVCALILLEKRE